MVGGMVRVEELRVGNIIRHINENGTFYLPVHSIHKDGFIAVSAKNGGEWGMLAEDFEPIPLSEEILIKAGFVKMLETEYTINTYQLGFIKLWDKKGDFSQLFIQLHEYIEIKHLHTLQNFYYLLSNCKELEIEL